MTTLRVILDEVLSPSPSGTARYAEELTRALIETAPAGCVVEGIVASSPASDYALLHEKLPGLGDLFKSALARRELTAAWQHGFTPLPAGLVHAPSLLAPLQRHDRLNDAGHQMVVTIHDAVAWTHPESLPARRVAWHTAMAKRAQRYADAVVVPTHAVAEQLAERFDFGDRVRVIGGAVSPSIRVPNLVEADVAAAALRLPERYLLAVAGLESRRGIERLLHALALPAAPRIPLLVVGPDLDEAESLKALAKEAGLPLRRVRALGYISDEQLSVALDRATALVFPSLDEGFGLPVLEAFSLGTPVIHSDAPALLEVSGGAGLAVELGDFGPGYESRLAEAIGRVVYDPGYAAELGTAGRDRAGLFTWRSSAEKVWQLHADL
jgi:glycosyltransferase involved in cell wall biosynthesis